MKHAALHDGTILEFPPETHDTVIDNTVRQHLGIPEPVDEAAQSQALVQEAVGVIAARIDQMTEQMAIGLDRVVQALDRLAVLENDEQDAQRHDVLVQEVGKLTEIISSGQAQLMAAVTLPRQVTTPDGRTFKSTVVGA